VNQSIFIVHAGQDYYPSGDNDMRSIHTDEATADDVALGFVRSENADWSSVIEVKPDLSFTTVVKMYRQSGSRIRIVRGNDESFVPFIAGEEIR
jgi:hypothetical protein